VKVLGYPKKAMILSAGFGTRLKPYTDTVPKPLLTVGDKPMILHCINMLRNNGIEEIVINLHYRGAMIREKLGTGGDYDVRIYYSDEPEILGTGGGVKKAEKFFEGEAFVLINCDVLTRVNLKEVYDFHKSKNALSTLILREKDTDKYNNIMADSELYIKDIAGRTRWHEKSFRVGMFAGIHILEPQILSFFPEGYSSITDRYVELIKQGVNLAGFFTESFWADLGNLEDYKKINKDIENGALKLNDVL